MTFPGLVAAQNLADVSSTDRAWDNLGASITADIKRENLLQWSESFDQGVWSKNNSTIQANAINAPDGKLTADKIIPQSSADPGVTVVPSKPTNNPPVIFSLFAKPDELSQVRLRLRDPASADAIAVTFDLSNNSFGGFGGSGFTGFLRSIEQVEDGWYRIAIGAFTNQSTEIRCRILPQINEEDFGLDKGLYIWGAQLEISDFLGPYIATESNATSKIVETKFTVTSKDIKGIGGTRTNSTADFVRVKGLSSLVQPRLSSAASDAASGTFLRDNALLKNNPTSEGDYLISRGALDGQSLRVNNVPVASLSGTPFSGSTATSPLLISSFNLPVNFRMSEAMASGTLTAPERAIPIESNQFILFAKAGQF
jgi:hypothetical protein